MNRYIKDDNIIEATTKAYEVIYKGQGYIPEEEYLNQEEVDNAKKAVGKGKKGNCKEGE
ncbi:hypothetical protein [Clostridium cadaveris]|uniref:hypothetical protein n=1 Tax=Clostridium cadaveris TaxID=1529 RepID=UPI0015D50133|nr:hypothetical protein [Clostridium cadaveris]